MADGFHGRRKKITARRASALVCFCSIAAGAACTTTSQNPAQSPEAQSHAEHELAKDSYKKG